jgi:1-acyl-sn-glycerol-3-phosphate acyltransferase
MLRAIDLLVRRGLRGVWLRGTPPPGPFVWAANHHSWWDPFVAMTVLHRWRRRSALLMRQTNLQRYPFARPLGIFGTDEPRRGLEYLRAGRVLIVYPEGELRPPGPPGRLAGGADWYATRSGLPLCAAATRVLMRGDQHPEAYLWLVTVTGAGALPAALRTTLADLDGLVATTDPRQPLPGFSRVVAGRRSADEQLERMARLLTWRR